MYVPSRSGTHAHEYETWYDMLEPGLAPLRRMEGEREIFVVQAERLMGAFTVPLGGAIES